MQQPLQGVLGGHAHMVGRAAGNDIELIHFPQLLGGDVQVLQHHSALLNAGGDGVPECFGLLHDLLEHEMLIAALLRGGDLPVHMVALLFHREQVGVGEHLDAVPGKHGDLPVVQVAYLPGVLDDSRHIGGQHLEAVPVAQDEGAVLPGGDQPVGAVSAQDAQGVGPLDPVENLCERLHHVAPVVVLQQLGHYLRVGLGDEVHPLGLQDLPNLRVVLNDPVMHHGESPVFAHLRVRVDVAGLPMGGPAGVPQAHGALQGLAAVHHVGEHLQPPLGFDHLHPFFLGPDGDARRVISSVFQPRQTIQQDGRGLLCSNESNDSAHIASPPI